MKTRDVRYKIKQNKLPEFPISKVTGRLMCGGWHIKGICNALCSDADDHVNYTTEEYKPMCTWCKNNWPKDE